MDLGWVGMTQVWSEEVRTSRWTSSMTTGGTIGGASGSTSGMDSGIVSMSQEWSRVVSAEVKEEYMTLQGIQTHCSQLTSQNPKTVKSHLSLTLMRVKLVNS